MTWKFITPNKPMLASHDFLHDLDDRYEIDIKLDGWRTEVVKNDNKIKFISRHDNEHKMPEKLSLHFNTMPNGMALDAEWINKSRIKALNSELNFNLPLIDCVVVFDVRWLNNKFILNTPLSARRNIEWYKKLKTVDINNIMNCDNMIFKMKSFDGTEALEIFNSLKNNNISEGVVVKRKDGGLKSNWYKVKYRK
jgi:ATP-dependent DNA ligase